MFQAKIVDWFTNDNGAVSITSIVNITGINITGQNAILGIQNFDNLIGWTAGNTTLAMQE